MYKKKLQLGLKRCFDILLALGALGLTLPISMVIMIISAVAFRGRIFFRQSRIGYYGRPFHLTKFRSIAKGYEEQPWANPSRWGQFLRKMSLDEIPEIWLVLLGKMSVVGPRPLLPEYMPLYTEGELQRHSMRPGLTGLALIKGGNALSWDARLAYDAEYVQTWSIGKDVAILAATLKLLTKGRKAHFSQPLTVERGHQREDTV